MLNTRLNNQLDAIYNTEVLTRFELYNSLFLTLPFYKIKDTGSLLPFFFKSCEEGIKKGKSPNEIIAYFFRNYTAHQSPEAIVDMLFRFIQYIERQVVLFDAVEDSVFNKLNSSEVLETLYLELKKAQDDPQALSHIEELISERSLKLVLTAHPTQFYPGNVLAIINDLTNAIKVNDINSITGLLQQLGKTPFFNKRSPTPVDEALSLTWFLENVFYFAAANIQSDLNDTMGEFGLASKKIIEMGFWPGGDRDGNPNVTTSSTLQVAKMLRQILFRCYYRDFRNLKRRITFKGTEEPIAELQDMLYKNAFDNDATNEDLSGVIKEHLNALKSTIINDHEGLFLKLVDDLLLKVELFGNHFASLDIRQDSRILRTAHAYCRSLLPGNGGYPDNYDALPEEEKLRLISFKETPDQLQVSEDPLIKDTMETIAAMNLIQQQNGEEATHRFIISNCQQASDILQLIELFLWNGWKKEDLTVDFVPLFETVNDLKGAGTIMEKLYSNTFYRQHIKDRGNKQDIMLGFSDSTKDGGYLMANWSIFNAKSSLTHITNKHNISLAFFDGRGGPPARGGGKTHRFYASMGKEIANRNIQLTVQGQTISSQYGSID
ncbi:MAG: phosphoenolpyruvate carboxylase, partial [Pedobacter sp.]